MFDDKSEEKKTFPVYYANSMLNIVVSIMHSIKKLHSFLELFTGLLPKKNYSIVPYLRHFLISF